MRRLSDPSGVIWHVVGKIAWLGIMWALILMGAGFSLRLAWRLFKLGWSTG